MEVMREQVVALLEQGLHDSAAILASFLVSAANGSSDVSSATRAEDLVLYADALYGKQEYRRALNFYKQAQQLSRVSSPARQSLSSRAGPLQSKQAGATVHAGPLSPAGTHGASVAVTSDAEVKLKVAQCYVALKETRAALTELESISPRLRTLQATLILARLYHSSGYDRAAVASYKECLRQNPYLVEAVTALAMLGAPAKDIQTQLPQPAVASKTRNGIDVLDPARWLSRLVEAHCSAASHDYKSALNTFRTLGNRFPGNTHLQVEIARAEAALGHCKEAIQSFQNARALDSHLVQAMDEYAILLQPRGPENWELNRLLSEVLSTDSCRPEAWVTAAIFWQAREDPAQALVYVEKAIRANDRHALAHLVKGNVALEAQRIEIAAASFRRVQSLHFDLRASQGLVSVYLAQEKHKEALLAAREAIKAMPQSAAALTLVGHVYARNQNDHDKARKFYESAIRHDDNCLEAVLALADLQLADGRYNLAYELLQRYIAKAANDELHVKLGQVLASWNRPEEALEQYEAALSMNPRNKDARLGLHRVEKLLKGQDPDAGEAEDDPDADDADADADQQDAEFFS